MGNRHTLCGLLRNKRGFAVLAVASALLVSLPFQSAQATTQPTDALVDFNTSPTAKAKTDVKYGLDLFMRFARQQGLSYMPDLAKAVNNPLAWTVDAFHTTADELGVPTPRLNDITFLANLLPADRALTRAPSPETSEAFWFSSDYRHKGFFPTHDSVRLGMNMRARGFGERAQVDLSPFYGQSWMGHGDYFGAETALTLRARNGTTMAKFTIRFDDGTRALMDHGRGYDMQGDVPVVDHLSLTAGLKQQAGEAHSNYVLAVYKISLGEGL